MALIRRSLLAVLVLKLIVAIARAGEPAPTQVADELKRLAPATVTVDRVEYVNGSDTRFLIAGRADRNATISSYLRALETSGRFHKTELLQVMLDGNGRPSFEIMLARQPEVERDARDEPAAAPAPAPKKPTVHRCMIDGREVFQSMPCPSGAKR